MSIYFSELCLLGHNPVDNVEQMQAAGGDHIELMLDGLGWESFDATCDDMVDRLRRSGITYSVHVPVWEGNLTSRSRWVREGVLESYRQTLLFAAKLGAQQVVVHPGFCSVPGDDKAGLRQLCSELLEQLFDYNKPLGLRLLLENVGTNRTSLFTLEQYIAFCRGLPPEGGTIIDIGHAHMNGWDLHELLMGVRHNLCALHIHDNDGSSDAHLPMGEGTVDWQQLRRTVQETGANPHLILEYEMDTPLCKLTEDMRTLQDWQR